jgi:hypothetical protein
LSAPSWGGWIGQMLGIGGADINDGAFNVGSLLLSLVGAVVLLAIINLFRRGSRALNAPVCNARRAVCKGPEIPGLCFERYLVSRIT